MIEIELGIIILLLAGLWSQNSVSWKNFWRWYAKKRGLL